MIKQGITEILPVASLDWDGCTGPIVDHSVRHAEICAKTEGKPYFVPRHHNYVKQIQEHIKKQLGNKKSIIVCGSARQDHQINNHNLMKKYNQYMAYKGTEYEGLIPTKNEVDAFYQFPRVVNLFNKTLGTNADFLPLLYPDQDVKEGTTMYTDESRLVCDCPIPLDDMKVNLLNFQADWLSKKYPEKQIKLSFYDDRLDILGALRREAVPNMPHNVTLKLYHADWFSYITGKAKEVITEFT